MMYPAILVDLLRMVWRFHVLVVQYPQDFHHLLIPLRLLLNNRSNHCIRPRQKRKLFLILQKKRSQVAFSLDTNRVHAQKENRETTRSLTDYTFTSNWKKIDFH